MNLPTKLETSVVPFFADQKNWHEQSVFQLVSVFFFSFVTTFSHKTLMVECVTVFWLFDRTLDFTLQVGLSLTISDQCIRRFILHQPLKLILVIQMAWTFHFYDCEIWCRIKKSKNGYKFVKFWRIGIYMLTIYLV